MSDYLIRTADNNDAAAIAAIYNHYVRSSTATFDTEEKSVEDRIAWLGEHGGAHPVLVAESGDSVVAWGSLSRWGSRSAYRHSVEISVYVAALSTRMGLGPVMAQTLLGHARRLGHHAVISQIVSENVASLKMTERLGFSKVGHLPEVGRKFDRWLDLVLMELILDPFGAEDPAP